MKKGIILGISMLLLAACSQSQGDASEVSGAESTESSTLVATSASDSSVVAESSEAAEISKKIEEVTAEIESVTDENAQLQAEIDSSEQSTIDGPVDATAKHIRDQAAAFIEITVPMDTELYGEDFPQMRIDLEPYVSKRLLDFLAPAEAGVFPPESEGWTKRELLDYQVLVDPEDMAGKDIRVIVNSVSRKNDYGNEFTIQENYDLEMTQEDGKWVVNWYTYSGSEYFGDLD